MKKNTIFVVMDKKSKINKIIRILKKIPSLKIVGCDFNALNLKKKIMISQPDFILIDNAIISDNNIGFLKNLMRHYPKTHHIVFSTTNEPESLIDLYSHGVEGFLMKGNFSEEIGHAIEQINNNKRYFSTDLTNTIINKYLEAV